MLDSERFFAKKWKYTRRYRPTQRLDFHAQVPTLLDAIPLSAIRPPPLTYSKVKTSFIYDEHVMCVLDLIGLLIALNAIFWIYDYLINTVYNLI